MSGSTNMRFASAVSDRVDSKAAVQQAVGALEVPPGAAPNLVLVFASPHHTKAFPHMANWLRAELGDATMLGVCGRGVIGGGAELEGREGLSVTAAWLPETRIRAVHTSELSAQSAMVQALGGGAPTRVPHCLVFSDGGTCDTDGLLRALDEALPTGAKLGGVVGGAEGAAFFIGDRVSTDGALLCSLDGACGLTTVVAQGCRPIGEPYIVTRFRNNVIDEFNAGKPTEVLRKVRDGLSDRDKSLFDTSLQLGLEMGNKGGRYSAGDFLMRNVLGIDRERGAIAVAARLRDYQVVQFHLRDRAAAAQDLALQLRRSALAERGDVRGALLFSCVGRGERMFGVPNHDSHAFIESVGPVSLSGMFCNGEIGSIGGKTFIHGYTSVFGAFHALPGK